MAVVAVGNTASKRVLEKIGMHAVESSEPLGPNRFQYFRIDAQAAMSSGPSTPNGIGSA
jgi:RimJ/RimL family protein N-acetyltransferase